MNELNRLEAYQYELPEELIAQSPATRRQDSRMLCLPMDGAPLSHHVFSELPELLSGNELLVLNNTRVVPARIFGRKPSGGKVELLLLGPWDGTVTEALAKSSKPLLEGGSVLIQTARGIVEAVVLQNLEDGRFALERPGPGKGAWLRLAQEVGQLPLPPYIRRQADPGKDGERYQTVYASRDGAVAAPTAGLHFTPEIFSRLKAAGVEWTELTLHVGTGTFQPVRVDDLALHRMHSECYEVSSGCAAAINKARVSGRPVIAVGTTVVRTLETVAGPDGLLREGTGSTDIFIRPPYRFRAISGLLTNFHLPGSTLLMLVSALVGRDRLLYAYREAIERRYRFFSYGDCMLIR